MSAADDFLKSFEENDDEDDSEEEQEPTQSSNPNSSNGDDKQISRGRLSEILKMGMAGANPAPPPKRPPVPTFASKPKAPVPIFAKGGDQKVSSTPSTGLCSNASKLAADSDEEEEEKKDEDEDDDEDDVKESDPDAPPGFNDAPPGFNDAPPGFNGAPPGSGSDAPPGFEKDSAPPGFAPPKSNGSSKNEAVGKKRGRDEASSSSSTKNKKMRDYRKPFVTVREVSERDWARVESILDLGLSRVKAEDRASREALKKSLDTNPLVQAIASKEEMRTRFNKMLGESIDFEEHLKPIKKILMDLCSL